jgi:hypothetical protein
MYVGEVVSVRTDLKATQTKTAPAPILLVPSRIEKMIASRQLAQVVKFRTTCTDCVPNM